MNAKKTSTEVVAQTTSTEVAVHQNIEQWGDNKMSSADLIIPKIVLQQGLSPMVADGKAKMGDILNSASSEIVGGVEKPLEIIPFYMDKIWFVSKKNGNDFEFVRSEPVTRDNEKSPWQFVEDGVEHKRDYAMIFYCLVTGQGDVPYTITMKGASRKAGQSLATQMYSINALSKLPPAGVAIELGVKMINEPKKKYATFAIKPKRKTTSEELESAFNWFQQIKLSQVKGEAFAEEEEIKHPATAPVDAMGNTINF